MPAAPEIVYNEWLDPEALADWMCPRPAHATKIECDPRIGGALRIDIDDSGIAMTITGRFLDLQPPYRLSFTWYCSTWAASDPDSIVTVTFEPYPSEQTIMTIEHAQLRPDLVDRHETGWAQIAEQFAEVLCGLSTEA